MVSCALATAESFAEFRVPCPLNPLPNDCRSRLAAENASRGTGKQHFQLYWSRPKIGPRVFPALKRTAVGPPQQADIAELGVYMAEQVRTRMVRFTAILPVTLLLATLPVHAQTAPTPAPTQNPSPSPTPSAAQAARRSFGPAIGVPVAGMPFVHDPSTVVRFHGQYYVFSTGRGAPFYSSPDAVTWTREGSVFTQIPDDVHAAVPKNDGANVWAPDIIRLNGQFYLYYAVSSWGSFQSAIGLATNPVLDPKDPAYKWTDRGVVVTSNGTEDLNAIDPGVILAPDGTLWICYGSYHGSIRVTQLDPKTGLALKPNTLGAPIATARESEASDIIFHNGFFYLFVNHGSCCKGKNSEYNIRVGRARVITGPYLDKHGIAMTDGGGSLFLAAHDHRIGPGHFGRVVDYDSPAGSDGPERFSIHYEADLTHGARSVLDIRPLLWSSDGWPIAGDNLVPGNYQIVSRLSENTLEEHVPAPPAKPTDPAVAATSASTAAAPTLHLARYLTLDVQQWAIAPVGAFYKIVNLATGDALGLSASAPTGSAIELAPYTGADTQLWGLDQFPDGSYRIRNKATGLALAASASATDPSSLIAAPFTRDDLHLWNIATP